MSPGCTIWLTFFWVFLPCFGMFILSLPLLGLGSKFTTLSPGFCVSRWRQYNTICWELNLISGFFAFFWLIVWVDGINKRGWCLAGGRGYWLKGPPQVPSVSWIYHHSLHLHIYQIVSFVRNAIPIVEIMGDGTGQSGWFLLGCGWVDRGWIWSYSFCFFHVLLYFVFSHILSHFI